MEPSQHERKWSLGYVAAATAVAALVWHLVGGLMQIASLGLTVFFAIVMASIFRLSVDGLSRWLPRIVATVITALGALGIVTGFFYLLVPLLVEQGRALVDRAPAALDRLEALWEAAQKNDTVGQFADGEIGQLKSRISEELTVLAQRTVPLAFGVVGAVGHLVTFFFLSLFLAHSPRAYRAGLFRLIPKRHSRAAVTTMNKVGDAIEGWTLGTLLSMAAVGALTTLGLLLVGVDSWLVLGLLAFFGEFVPYIGPALTAVPGIAMGFTEGPQTGLLTLAVYIVVQQIEGVILQPLIMRRAVDLRPALLIVWQLVMLAAFGFLGVVVATPLLAAIKVSVEYLYVERALGRRPSMRVAETTSAPGRKHVP